MKNWIALLLLTCTLRTFATPENSPESQISNKAIAWNWRMTNGHVESVSIEDKLNGQTIPMTGNCFEVELGDGTMLKPSDFTLLAPPSVARLKPDNHSPVAARHFAGEQFMAEYSAPGYGLAAEWSVTVRKHSTWLRRILALKATSGDVFIKKIILFDEKIPGAKTAGTVEGSPVVAGNFFFGCEHPMSQNLVDSNSTICCSFLRNAILERDETLTESCVMGVAPAGQLRRGFAAYIEAERAHPYRPFLHYNSWYDISWSDRKYDAGECVRAIDEIGVQLVRKRGVRVDSFLFDDGWDDDRTLWQFNSGFPEGFTPLQKAAATYRSGIGVWLSPFGGYGAAKAERLQYASRFGYETNVSGFSLAGPRYFQRFHDICLQMVKKYGVNQFKFDGLAAGATAANRGLTRDGDAMMRLIGDLRQADPNIYINETTGTWPSPFWLLDVDSTWRGGADHSFAGKGSWCEQWMTYRDEQTYRNVVQRAPLYPLNSLMLHGIIYATHALHLNTMSDADFAAQAREFFGNGTQLQELYITPSLLDKQNWDDLAEAAKWSRANAATLEDTHWMGGDPGKGEVYGWASWSPHNAILVLRNPDDRVGTYHLNAASALELPAGANRTFHFHSPWKCDKNKPFIDLRAGDRHTFYLQPFQVLVLEARS